MNKEELLEKLRETDVAGKSLKELYMEISAVCMEAVKGDWKKMSFPKNTGPTVYYFSIEFLIGRMFYNNLMALGVLKEAREIFAAKGIDLNAFEDVEDAALGNGGLGRLAACYLDSGANAGLSLHGFGLRYRYGLFRQKFRDGRQTEEKDDWLKWGDPWSIRREKEKIEVHFADMTVTAVPYDMPVFGKTINTLRLFQAKGSKEAEKICEYLYPADDTEEGKLLRIRQEYFLSAAAVGQLVKNFVKEYGKNFDCFPDCQVFQLNDTHCVFAVAEFLRLLNKEYHVPFARAIEIAKRTFHYTNHTILPEALECWDIESVEKILPDIAHILNRLHIAARQEWRGSKSETDKMSILQNKRFSMANAAVYISRKVNGVAEIHSQILKDKLFATAYKYYPDKFLNVTNGVTPRRWLMLCNEELAGFYDSRLGVKWRTNFAEIGEIPCGQKSNLEEFAEVKKTKKKQLAGYIKKREGVELLPDAVYVAQVKRLHEYKRQLMTAFAILHLYFELKEGRLPGFTPMVFLFGAKAASGYKRAKAVIKYINDIAELVNGDGDVNTRLQVVFVQNYDVSYAEKIIPGTDVSLQVSTAGFEASGTGNMKFMMNGAVTLGTMDGANIEIIEKAGAENNYIFGATVEEVAQIKDSYDPRQFIIDHPALRRVTDTLTDGTFAPCEELDEIYKATFEKTYNSADHYLVLYDLPGFIEALLKVNLEYKDRELFTRKQLENATHSAFFSSDRAIKEYADKVWKN